MRSNLFYIQYITLNIIHKDYYIYDPGKYLYRYCNILFNSNEALDEKKRGRLEVKSQLLEY